MKIRLIKQVEEVEIEKQKLKSMQLDKTKNDIDSYLSEELLLSLNSELINTDDKTEDLQQQLTNIHIKFRANQNELNNYFLNKIKSVVNFYVDGADGNL